MGIKQLTATAVTGTEHASGQGSRAKRTEAWRTNAKTTSRQLKRKSLDYITVLATAEQGKRACKRFFMHDGKLNVEGYNAGFKFKVLSPLPVSNIAELSDVLMAIEPTPEYFAIRGAPAHANLIGTVARRTGSGEGRAFTGNFMTPAQGRHYMEIDVDDYPFPPSLCLHRDTCAVCDYLISHLPIEFRDASYHYQLSSQAGMKGANLARIHLWFWLDRPIPDRELKAWANHVNQISSRKLIDPALFQHVQVHYTAAPIFEGVTDPFPVRSALVVKRLGTVNLNLRCLAKRPAPQSLASPATSTTRATPGGSGFNYHLSQIGDHPGGAGFRQALLSATASYVAEHGQDGTDGDLLYQSLRDAVLAADAQDHTAVEISDRASEAVIMPMIASAMTKFGDNRAPRSKSRRILGIEPHYQVGSHIEGSARKQLDDLLDQVF